MRQGRRFGKMIIGAMSTKVHITDQEVVHPIEQYINEETKDDIDILVDGIISQRYIYAGLRKKGLTHKEAMEKILKEYDF
jgi:Cft2 family RNA processing exonuclease